MQERNRARERNSTGSNIRGRMRFGLLQAGFRSVCVREAHMAGDGEYSKGHSANGDM